MDTGENQQALRASIDFIRMGSIILLAIHFYFYCYNAMEIWGLTTAVVQRLFLNLGSTGLFDSFHRSKLFSLGLLFVSLLGSQGKKEEKIRPVNLAIMLVIGFSLYFSSIAFFYLNLTVEATAIFYILITSTGFFLILTGIGRLSRLIKLNLQKDIFNEENESFPQQEALLENEYSLNFPATYILKGKPRKSWINVVSPHRATLVCAGPGAAKSTGLIMPAIRTFIQKGHCLFLYDFKYPDLTNIAYNTFLKNKDKYKVVPQFFIINFDDLSQTNRCNPLEPSTMLDVTDASEAARSILLGLNREWIRKTGDFWVESAINFFTAIIWFLKTYKNGKYCTLPHALELLSVDYNDLFPVLLTEPTLENLINPFLSAYLNRASEQLEGQIGSAKISLARLSSPQLYFVLSGDEFSLDINNPEEPKLVCVGNNPAKVGIYGAVLGLYINRVGRLVARKGGHKCAIICDEFSSLFWNGIESLIAIARGYRVSIMLAIQDYAQLKRDYSREQAEIIMNICSNIFCGQAVGEVAKLVSERIGKIVQTRESVSINRQDTSISKNTQLDLAVPPSRISNLSTGEFVGVVADTPSQPIKYKSFHAKLDIDFDALTEEEKTNKPLPKIRDVSALEVQNNFITIKNEIFDLIDSELTRIKNDPDLAHLIIRPAGKEQGNKS